jgi:membrane-associated phospholipid phosphatase
MLRLAKLISVVFHPLGMPLGIFIIALLFDPYFSNFFPPQLIGLFTVILLVNIIAPGISLYFMWKRGLIADLDISKRSERWIPFFIVLVYYLLSYYMLRQRDLPVPFAVYSMFLGVIITLFVSIVINSIWKISIHMMAAGGLVGTFAGLFIAHHYTNIGLLSGLIAIAAFVGFARIYTGNHTAAQVYAGFLVGFLLNFSALALGWIV